MNRFGRFRSNVVFRQEARPVLLVGAITALALIGDSMLYVVLPVYWQDAGLTALWQVGILLSINRLVRLPLNPVIGWLYQRIPIKAGLAAAVALAAVTTSGYGWGKGFALWLVLRSVWGLAWSFLRMGGYLTVIGCSNETNRGRLMGMYNGIWRIGSLAGFLLGGLLVPLVGLSAVSTAFGLAALAGLPVIALSVLPEVGRTERSARAGAAKQSALWSGPASQILLVGLAVSLLQAVVGATLTYIIDANHSDGAGILFAGIVVSSTALSGALQALRFAWEPFLAARFGALSDGPRGRAPYLIAALFASAVGYSLLPWNIPLPLWIAVVLFVMLAGTALTTLTDAIAADTARSTSVIALMTAYIVTTDLGAALGPALAYLTLHSAYGLEATFLSCAVVFVLLGLWYRLGKKTQTETNDETAGRREKGQEAKREGAPG
jgi:predicted MFS family arabinose efflux permease